MTKGLITEYDYKDDQNSKYNIIRVLRNGSEVIMNDGIGQTLEVVGLDQAMKMAQMLNENAGENIKYKVRKI